MKEPTEEIGELSEAEWAKLSALIRDYNSYVDERLKTIMEFDIWYEHSTAQDFPKQWYSMIRESASHK